MSVALQITRFSSETNLSLIPCPMYVLRLKHYAYISAVPPEVTLVQSENGTVVCKAVAGKPAAQISWTPEGDCVTEQNPHGGNGTVTVWSMCYWKARHVPNVSCTVSHVTGNKSLFLELNQG